jgi:predicted PP-loop superfamily ATPase
VFHIEWSKTRVERLLGWVNGFWGCVPNMEKAKVKAALFGKANPKGRATQDRINRVKGAAPAMEDVVMVLGPKFGRGTCL